MATLVLQAKHWSAANALLCYNLHFASYSGWVRMPAAWVNCSDTRFWSLVRCPYHVPSTFKNRPFKKSTCRNARAETSFARHRFCGITENLPMTADFTFIIALVSSHHRYVNVPPSTEKKAEQRFPLSMHQEACLCVETCIQLDWKLHRGLHKNPLVSA